MKNNAFAWFALLGLCALSLMSVIISPFITLSLKLICAGLFLIISLFPISLFIASSKAASIGTELQAEREQPRVIVVFMVLTYTTLMAVILFWRFNTTVAFTLFTFTIWGYFVSIIWGWHTSQVHRAKLAQAFDKSRISHGLVFLLICTLMFCAVEITLRLVQVQSNGFGNTAQARAWSERYFHPMNSLGMRGYEPVSPNDEQQHILVIGDSFVIGHGVRNIDDVFGYQLRENLSEDFVVNIHGRNGLSPSVEWLESYPLAPDILVLSYYHNDIEPFAPEYSAPSLSQLNVPLSISWWTDFYFVFSFLYWYGYVGPSLADNYVNDLLSAYNDPSVWELFQPELQKFVDWSDENEAKLIVVIWPNLADMASSDAADTMVATHFEQQGIPAIRMSEVLADLPTAKRIINPLDAHPSVLAHDMAAQALAEVIQSLDK